MLDQVLARRQEPAVLDHARLEAGVHRLDEPVVLGPTCSLKAIISSIVFCGTSSEKK